MTLLDPAPPPAAPVRPAPAARPWMPRRVLLTRSARDWAHGRAIAERAGRLGLDVEELATDRIAPALRGDTPRDIYVGAKSTLAVVVAPPNKRKLQPIPPSADWRFDLAEGCPAHCQYCYLAGSLAGPPVTRAYANLPEILGGLAAYAGAGTITSRSESRAREGTTFEASCYTDPLGIEHLTGSLAEAVRFFGAWDAAVQLRFTTKFAGVEPLLGLPHAGRTRVRMSVTAPALVRFEGGTAPLDARLAALRRLALDRYPVGLTVAPIMPADGWREGYADLAGRAARALGDVPDLDLTAEFITHRFTPKSKGVLLDWYPATRLDMDEANRVRKLTKFGSVKHVYPKPVMTEMRDELTRLFAAHLPQARALYWT